ncbi:MAG: transcriptional regulator [Thermoproteota archaeon]|nr:transcriptional regulator [Thermoproteota archaeon]
MSIKRKGSKGTGAVLLFVSIAVFIAYAYFLLGTEWSVLILQLTALATVSILLMVLGWIGYTMLTAPKEEEKKG